MNFRRAPFYFARMDDRRALIEELARLGTEQVNENTVDIDRLPALEIVRIINAEDRKVAAVVERALPEIARAAEIYAAVLRAGGRVFSIGAGTSGRLGVLDAAECPPTFGTDPARIIGVISGGYDTLVLSQEGVEDRADAAAADLQRHGLGPGDFVIGLAASVRTPYTRAGLEYARSLGAKTAFLICNDPVNLPPGLDVVIALPVGPEVIAGSTRMKSGTAQKMALNMISTAAMVLLGKTYGNLMVDLQARSEKLAARSRKILIDLLRLEYEEADRLLEAAGGSVKTAIVMQKLKCTAAEARALLARHGGFVRNVLQQENP
ncbi:MAG TPA: N-acetylmuramic acid 6-phosphate etherase [candidate division Zixibacteria bacterium]|nr:N-acetylmuramic acid 6-phosphate etherase [candidate division Zixibacteria bacterium]